MTRERYTQVQWHGEPLTEEERRQWHFCWDWDGLLIHKDDPEFECCSCAGGKHVREQA